MKRILILLLLIFPFVLFAQLRKKIFNENISFDFVAKRKPLKLRKGKVEKRNIEILIHITNNNDDTLYAFNHGCIDGYYIDYDKSLFKSSEEEYFLCNAIPPCVTKIKPKEKTIITLNIKPIFKKTVSKIKIGCGVFRVNRYYSQNEIYDYLKNDNLKKDEIFIGSFEKPIQ